MAEKDENAKERPRGKKMAGCVGSKKLRKENPRNVLKRKWLTISDTAERLNEMNTRKRSLVLASGK